MRLPDVPGAGYVLLFGIYGVMFLVSVLALRGVAAPARAPGRRWPAVARIAGSPAA